MIAAVATTLAACSNIDTFKDVNTQEMPIAFEQALNKTTRSAITNAETLADNGGFVVYGYNTAVKESNAYVWTSPVTVFNAIDVTSNDNGATWATSVTRFWNKNASYNFYAIAPANTTAKAKYGIKQGTGATDLKFTITGAESAIYTASQDYLIDRDGAKGVTYETSTNGTVAMDFHHIMAKIQVKLKSSLNPGKNEAGQNTSAKITVTSLTMEGWDKNTGNFSQVRVVTPTELTAQDEWTLATTEQTKGNVTLIPSVSDNTQASIELTCGDANDIEDVADWYIMVPQVIAANGLKFTLTYTYVNDNGTPSNATDDYTETFENQTATITTAQTWGTDSHTTYTLDVKPSAIDFSVTVCGFGHDNTIVTPDDVEVK